MKDNTEFVRLGNIYEDENQKEVMPIMFYYKEDKSVPLVLYIRKQRTGLWTDVVLSLENKKEHLLEKSESKMAQITRDFFLNKYKPDVDGVELLKDIHDIQLPKLNKELINTANLAGGN